MLDIQHLTKTYGEKKAVDDLSLHIAPGEIYGFIGHNGAGKTTTLKSVVGILQFDQGEITIDGRSIKADPLGCKREMAYIPDNPDLYDYMTGIKYLNFIADVFGVDAQTRQARIRTYADAFELTGDLAQPIAAYSHGMKQKLSIIAAWLHDPKVIIMDEPFVGLDPKHAHQHTDQGKEGEVQPIQTGLVQGSAQTYGEQREHTADNTHHQQHIQHDQTDGACLGPGFVLFRVVEVAAEDLGQLFFQQ